LGGHVALASEAIEFGWAWGRGHIGC
jgi:hypothetical protein